MSLVEILSKKIIQGGMGVSISTWLLARTVSLEGGLGTVSGVGAERILAYSLQRGDEGGHFRRALTSFPYQEMSKLIIDEYFVEGGIKENTPYKKIGMFTMNPSESLKMLTVCGNYCLVWLSKEGHNNPISINWLEKVQLPHIYAITGAMLAGVDCITMGAGMVFQIPGIIKKIIDGENPSYRIYVEGNTKNVENVIVFNLKEFFGNKIPKFKKPLFLPIVSSDVVASILLSKCPDNSIDGFIVENPRAAGHNAPPRNKQVSIDNEPIYNQKDECNFDKMKSFGIPFWIGGSLASPSSLLYALSMGAQGIQVGSIFELAEESGLKSDLKIQIKKTGWNETLVVKNYSNISPTFFPFHEAYVKNTLSEKYIYEKRKRVCNVGLLRTLYIKPNGEIGYRCPAEDINAYLKKGGKIEDTVGKICLCNALFSSAGLADYNEDPSVTLSKDYNYLKYLMKHEDDSYTVADVMKYLLK